MLREILYTLAIPAWHPLEATPLQGFAPGLIQLVPMLTVLPMLPSDIDELTMDPSDRLSRRRAGQGEWNWSPVNVETLVGRRIPSDAMPFMVVFTAHEDAARRVATWRRNLRVKPLHVSHLDIGGAVQVEDLTVERLQRHCLSVLRQLGPKTRREADDARASIEAWRPFEPRPSNLRHHSHNVVLANEMVLLSTGQQPGDGEGRLDMSPEQDYIDGITQSVEAVRELHGQTADRPVYLLNPPRPDTILFAPAMIKGAENHPLLIATPSVKAALRSLDRQTGYTTRVAAPDNADVDQIQAVMQLRGQELMIASVAEGMRAASTMAATIRLPARVNRTAGVVRDLARYLRHHENPPPIKTARVFKRVQDALAASVPAEHLALLAGSTSGVKIVADAPLEWLPIDGLPLGIRHDVSRINSTPGNIFIEQIRSMPPHYVHSEAFKDYLVLSMFEAGDGIAYHARRALEVLPGADNGQLTGRSIAPRSVDEFVDSVNAYEGPILIVDSHGAHPEAPDVGGLIIGGQPVDIWNLRGRIRLPPIVVLSACDTHPFDRSHATIANGFLSCGAVTVLGTVLPVDARHSAVFLVRLMLRAIEFGNAMNGIGRSAAWTKIVGGALRMMLASDIIHGLGARGLVPEEAWADLQLPTNEDLNPPHERPDWLERLRDRCREMGGFTEAQWDVAYADILAGSDVIRYVNLGNPEAILISDERVVRRAMVESRELDGSHLR